MTAAEYALIALICQKSGFFPRGNNNYGKDYRESEESAIPATYNFTGTSVHAVLTGTGAVNYSHDNTLSGIYDLNGYPAEWIGGRRIYNGEIQLIPNNNAADSNVSQAYASSAWKAIDATTGGFVTPNGSGTTENTIKLDATGNKPIWDTEVSTTTSATFTNGLFKSIQCSSGISAAAKATLAAYLLYTSGGSWGNDNVNYNNTGGESLFTLGQGLDAEGADGVASIRQAARSSISAGFRCAYVNLGNS